VLETGVGGISPLFFKSAYRIAGKFGEFTRYEHLVKEVWQINRFSQKVIIVSRNLDGFSLVNQG